MLRRLIYLKIKPLRLIRNNKKLPSHKARRFLSQKAMQKVQIIIIIILKFTKKQFSDFSEAVIFTSNSDWTEVISFINLQINLNPRIYKRRTSMVKRLEISSKTSS